MKYQSHILGLQVRFWHKGWYWSPLLMLWTVWRHLILISWDVSRVWGLRLGDTTSKWSHHARPQGTVAEISDIVHTHLQWFSTATKISQQFCVNGIGIKDSNFLGGNGGLYILWAWYILAMCNQFFVAPEY